MNDSLSKQFKRQLDDLIKMLSQSNPRFVKCIKPNGEKIPIKLDSTDVRAQLLSAGVLEAVKIIKQGYSIRRTQEEFFMRYFALAPEIIKGNKEEIQKDGYKKLIVKMIEIFIKEKELKKYLSDTFYFQIGYSKIFMKEEVRNALEYKLNKLKYVNFISSFFKGFLVRRKIRKIIKSTNLIQKYLKYKKLIKEGRKLIMTIDHYSIHVISPTISVWLGRFPAHGLSK